MDTDVRYCRTADGAVVAFSADGPTTAPTVLVLRIPWVSSLEPVEGFFDWHLSGAPLRIVRFSPRGSGSSDRDVEDFSLEARLADVDAVAGAVGADSYIFFAMADTTMTAMAWAAHHPERVSKLLLQSPSSSGAALWSTPRRALLAELAAKDWEMFSEVWPLALWGWDIEPDARRRYAGAIRSSISQANFLRYVEASRQIDVAGCLQHIDVPTLIITGEEMGAGRSRAHAFNNPAAIRTVAAGLKNTRLVATTPETYGPVIREFLSVADPLAGSGNAPSIRRQSGAELRTILFTDVEGHTEMTARLGDAAAREVLREHERITRRALRQHGGTEVKAMGDGFLAWFPSATRALDCAVALQTDFRAFTAKGGEPLRVRVGINAGEPLQEGGDIFGQAVITASRVAASADGGHVVVTDVVRQLVAGKAFIFADRGSTLLRGLDEPVHTWELVW